MIDLAQERAAEALGTEAERIAYHERVRQALGARPGEPTLGAAERVAGELRALLSGIEALDRYYERADVEPACVRDLIRMRDALRRGR